MKKFFVLIILAISATLLSVFFVYQDCGNATGFCVPIGGWPLLWYSSFIPILANLIIDFMFYLVVISAAWIVLLFGTGKLKVIEKRKKHRTGRARL